MWNKYDNIVVVEISTSGNHLDGCFYKREEAEKFINRLHGVGIFDYKILEKFVR